MCVLILFSCKQEEEKPIEVSQDNVDLLSDLLIVEGVLQDFTGDSRDSAVAFYYREVYNKYRLNPNELDSIRKEMRQNPKLLERTMDSVIVRLTRIRENPTLFFDQNVIK